MSSCPFRAPVQLPAGVLASNLTSTQSFIHCTPFPMRILSRYTMPSIRPRHKHFDGCSSPTEDTFSSPQSGPPPTFHSSLPSCPLGPHTIYILEIPKNFHLLVCSTRTYSMISFQLGMFYPVSFTYAATQGSSPQRSFSTCPRQGTMPSPVLTKHLGTPLALEYWND